MKCGQARKVLTSEERGSLAEAVQEHLATCAECRMYAAEVARLAEGMRFLALDPVPEPSIGFCERLIRSLERQVNAPADFLEYAGQRVVFASLLLVFFLLLAMTISSSGPFRQKTTSTTYWPPEESETAQEFLSPSETLPPTPVLVDFRSTRPVSAGGR